MLQQIVPGRIAPDLVIADRINACEAMICLGHRDEVTALAGPDQRVHELHRVRKGRIDVTCWMHDQQLAFQPVSQTQIARVFVDLGDILRPPAHIVLDGQSENRIQPGSGRQGNADLVQVRCLNRARVV